MVRDYNREELALAVQCAIDLCICALRDIVIGGDEVKERHRAALAELGRLRRQLDHYDRALLAAPT